MKLVSFDIGIRNLAYCVLEGTDRTDLVITNWDVIDVLAEESGLDSPKCFKCKKHASWKQSETNAYACYLHCPKDKAVAHTKKSISAKSIDDLRKDITRLGIEVKTTTKKEAVDKLYEYYKSRSWIRCIKSANTMSIVDCADPIAKSLKKRLAMWRDADLVVLEQQPDARMISVQAMIHMWFVCHGFKCRGISPQYKLNNITTLDPTKTYKDRKKTGIIHANQLVPQECKDFMAKHPKKDDLADCFLQGLWALEHPMR